MDSYKSIERKLATHSPFNGNSMTARWEGATYVVYSYGTEIAKTSINGIDFNTQRYSVTTSRHQNLVRKVWGINALVGKASRKGN